MIDIQELTQVTQKEILKLLEEEQSNKIEVSIPKDTQQFFSDSNDIALEFACAAYVGHLLSAISTKFEYSSISPSTNNDFYFTVIVEDLDKLAETILEISYLFNNEPEEEDEFLWVPVYNYIDKVNENKIEPVCADFVEICNELRYNDEDEENDDE